MEGEARVGRKSTVAGLSQGVEKEERRGYNDWRLEERHVVRDAQEGKGEMADEGKGRWLSID